MVRRGKSLWHTRQWYRRWRNGRTRRCSGSPGVPTPVGRHTIPPTVDRPGRNWRIVTRRVIVCLWCPATPGRQRWNCPHSVNTNGRPKSQELACRNSARVLYLVSKVLGQFRSMALLHFWPGQCRCGACVHRGACRFQVAGIGGRFPAKTVSKGLRTLKLSVWR
jgi:hypothetical protein